MNVGYLRELIGQLPDDAEIWMEYPARYGLAQPEIIESYSCPFNGETDLIQSLTIGIDRKKNRLIIYHHY